MLNKEDKEYFSNMGYDVKSIEIGVAYALGAKVQGKIPALLRGGNEISKGQVKKFSKHKNIDLSLVFTQSELQSIKKLFSDSIAKLEKKRNIDKQLYAMAKSKSMESKTQWFNELQNTSRKIKRLAKLQTKLKKV